MRHHGSHAVHGLWERNGRHAPSGNGTVAVEFCCVDIAADAVGVVSANHNQVILCAHHGGIAQRNGQSCQCGPSADADIARAGILKGGAVNRVHNRRTVVSADAIKIVAPCAQLVAVKRSGNVGGGLPVVQGSAHQTRFRNNGVVVDHGPVRVALGEIVVRSLGKGYLCP